MNRNESNSIFSMRVSVGWLLTLLAALGPICLLAFIHLADLMYRNYLMRPQDYWTIIMEIVLIAAIILTAIWRPTRHPAAILIAMGAASVFILYPLIIGAVEIYAVYGAIMAITCLGAGAAMLPSDSRFIRRIEALAFLAILASGVLALWTPMAGLIAAGVIAVNLGLFWLINRAPLWVFPALIFVGIIFFAIAGVTFFESTTTQYSHGVQHHTAVLGITSMLFNPGLVFWLVVLFIACTMLPRRESWGRLWLPWLTRPRNPSSKQRAFTLIELLIAIAMLSILFSGTFSVWGYQLKAMRMQNIQRAAATILDSQMDALMNAPSIPRPSEAIHPLPIDLNDLHAPPGFSGGFTVAESELPGLLHLEVILTYEGLDATQKHFRYIAERRRNREAHHE